jgi:adenine-specific DNA-methyltransferase
VQIGDESLHRVRCVLDEVFGSENCLGLIAFVTTGGQSAELLGNVFNFLLWYGRDVAQVKYRQLFIEKELREGGGWAHSRVEFEDGRRENVGVMEAKRLISESVQVRPYSQDGLASQGATVSGSQPFVFQGRSFRLPSNSHWKTTVTGMERLAQCDRIEASENSIRYVRFLDDFSVQPITNVWGDTNRPGYIDAKLYVVQTSAKVIERCLLMTTDPGDLVLDPTCGSGTTAYVTEQWGRRWITIDTSRVALALARQRLLTATFPYYRESGGMVSRHGL